MSTRDYEGEVVVLSSSHVAELLPWDACIAAVERAFRAAGEPVPAPFGSLGIHLEGGGFHVKAGALHTGRSYFAAKVNGNFPGNQALGLPTIQGVVVLADAENGRTLAIMDSAEITRRRTAAATAVAARHLARAGSTSVAIIGCGVQAGATVEALQAVLPLRRVMAMDRDADKAERLAESLRSTGFDAVASVNRSDLRGVDVIVTCTTSQSPVLFAADVAPGAFVAAVGADHPEKREIAADLMAGAAVVVDVLAQAAEFGDLHHALADGVLRREDVRAELGDVVAGRAAGRRSVEEIVLFDSTGMALQDVAAAALVYERACESGAGLRVELC